MTVAFATNLFFMVQSYPLDFDGQHNSAAGPIKSYALCCYCGFLVVVVVVVVLVVVTVVIAVVVAVDGVVGVVVVVVVVVPCSWFVVVVCQRWLIHQPKTHDSILSHYS